MDGIRPGDLAIVDFKLGGTETRTLTYGGGGGGALIMGSGQLSGGWVRSEAVQTNTIPMPASRAASFIPSPSSTVLTQLSGPAHSR